MAVITPDSFIAATDVVGKWGLNMIIYGPPGAGKTTLCATAQESEFGADVLIVDVDKGSRSVSDREGVKIFPVNSWSDVNSLFNYLNSKDHNFKTICIDTITELQEYSVKHVLGGADRPPQLQDFMKSKQQMCKMMRAFKGLSIDKGWNIFFNAHVKVDEDKINGTLQRKPLLSPSTQSAAMGIVDGIGFLDANNKGVRNLQLQPSYSAYAKFRQPSAGKSAKELAGNIKNPNMGKILDFVNGKTDTPG